MNHPSSPPEQRTVPCIEKNYATYRVLTPNLTTNLNRISVAHYGVCMCANHLIVFRKCESVNSHQFAYDALVTSTFAKKQWIAPCVRVLHERMRRLRLLQYDIRHKDHHQSELGDSFTSGYPRTHTRFTRRVLLLLSEIQYQTEAKHYPHVTYECSLL